MEFLEVQLKHEEMHFVGTGEVQIHIYVSQVVGGNTWLVTKHESSRIHFVKEPVKCYALVNSLSSAREKALKLKDKLMEGANTNG